MAQLDGLRALAVVAVFVQHALPGGWAASVGSGYYGVILFFVLSGYLITLVLLRCRAAMLAGQTFGITLRQFYVRRFLRIVPLFYFVLGMAALLDVAPVRESFWWHASYLSNFYFVARGDWNGPVTPFWTLALEEQFYLVWPWVVLLTPPAWLLTTIAGLVALCPLVRWLYSWLGVTSFSIGLLPFGNTDFLLIGALLAELDGRAASGASWRTALGRAGVWVGLPAYAGAIAVATLGTRSVVLLTGLTVFHWFFAKAAIGFFFFWLVDGARRGFRGVLGTVLSAPPAQAIGRVSYGMYVYQTFVIALLATLATWVGLDVRGLALFATRFMVLFGVASVSWYGFERPINELKRYFPYRLARAADLHEAASLVYRSPS